MLAQDQAVIAENVEFHSSSRSAHSTIGTRRAGTSQVTTPITASSEVVKLHRHLPTTDETAAELWAVSTLSGTPTIRYKNTAWNTVTIGDTLNVSGTVKYQMQMQTLHGKLFLAADTNVDRLHVRDAGGSTFRRTGLAEPAAPSVANTGAGSYTGTRYFRVRYKLVSGSLVLRSEPSAVTTFVPSGSGSASRITKPASISENETHWEVEASLDNANFYRIATVVVGTTTYDDSTSFSSGYANAAGAVLSEDSGDYDVLHSAKFLTADDDRLLIAGSWENEALSSRVAWTPVLNDPGDGNDERSPIDTDNFIDLNTYEGGAISGMSRTVNGYIFVFKRGHIYQLTRTGQRTRAYTAHALSKDKGAVPGSTIEGLDQNGRPCVYFLDPETGPSRIGDGGIQACGLDIHKTWETVNQGADIVARAIYYSDSNQIHWWIATGAATTPNLLIVLHTDLCRQAPDGVRGGWVTFNGNRAAAISTCLFADNIEANAARSITLRPFIGKTDGTIHLCDTGTTDSGTAFAARIRTAPLVINLLQKQGIMDAALVAVAASGVTVVTKVIRNFGEETKSYNVLLTPDGSEDPVIKAIDNFNISEANTIQLEFADEATPSGNWNIYMFAAEQRAEE
jgi:hypothetical protein